MWRKGWEKWAVAIVAGLTCTGLFFQQDIPARNFAPGSVPMELLHSFLAQPSRLIRASLPALLDLDNAVPTPARPSRLLCAGQEPRYPTLNASQKVQDFVHDVDKKWRFDSSEEVTLVTAFFNLGSFIKGGTRRDPSHYFSWLDPFRRIRNPLMAFSDDPEFLARLRRIREGVLCQLSPSDVFLREPLERPYHTNAGDTALKLECAVKAEFAAHLQWLSVSGSNKAPRIITLGEQNLDSRHYELDTSGSKGTYNLLIKEVNFEKDNANFYCQVDDREGSVYTSRKAQVIVLVRPGRPVISGQTNIPIAEGQLAYVECSSEGGNPAPTITWTFANNSAVPDTFVRREEGGIGAATTSRVTWPATADDNDGPLTCLVWNEAMGEETPVRVASAPLSVLFAPKVSLDQVASLRLEEGTMLTLACNARGNPPSFTYKWEQTGGTRTPAFSAQTARAELRIEREDAGRYTCTVANSVGSGAASTELDVLYRPRPTIRPLRPVARGSTVKLRCDVDANPPADKISWVSPDGRRTPGDVLELTKIAKNQAGNYTCEAVNRLPLIGGAETRQGNDVTELKVRYPPGRAVISVQDDVVVVGSAVTLFCAATEPGEPLAEFRWKAPGQSEYLFNPQSSYTIQNVQLANAGEYWCKPENQLDETTKGDGTPGSFVLRVTQPAQLDAALPPNPLELRANLTADPIRCEGSGNPRPVITWFKDDEAISDEEGESIVPSRWAISASSVNGGCGDELRCPFRVSSTLRWEGAVRWSDKGRYTCRVGNGQPRSPESSLLVRVRHAPKIDDHASRTQAAAEIGGTAYIRCRTSALPVPSFRWTFEGGEGGDIREGGRFAFEVDRNLTTDTTIHSLRISGVSDADLGKYLCRASNEFGEAKQQFRLKRGGKPEPPTGLKLVDAGESWLRLAWEPGFDGGFPQTFQLQLTPLNPIGGEPVGQASTYAVPGPPDLPGRRQKRYINDVFDTMIKYNVSQLLPGRKFYFMVKAKNEKDDTRYSDGANAKTAVATPDRSIVRVQSAIYNAVDGTLSFKPTLGTEFCLLVELESAAARGDWGTLDCRSASAEKLEGLPGGAANLRLRFRRKADGACGNSTMAMHATDVSSGGIPWKGTVIPILAVAGLLLLLGVIGGVCCCVRSRQSAPKKRTVGNVRSDYEMETNAARPKAISGPFLQREGTLEKVPAEGSSGANTGLSNGDSGVFTTLGSLSRGQAFAYEPAGPELGFHNGGYGPPDGPDVWANDPFDPNDPYNGAYGMDYGDGGDFGAAPVGPGGYYDPYGNPGAMVDLNPQGTLPNGGSNEGSVHSGYSTPNARRVMREIIV